jgi:NitT/TauT family transport system substrate-binding protein
VKKLVQALYDSINTINADPTAASTVIASGITKASGKSFKASLAVDSMKSITFTLDPVASSLFTVADHQSTLGLNKKQNLDGIFDLAITNEVLKAAGKPEVASK